jgi:hypothetical protein
MDNLVKSFFKPKALVRSVDLASPGGTMPVQSAKCEVVEYDNITGMEQWNDSIFMQDFEDFVLTMPAPLTLTSRDELPQQMSPDLIEIRDFLGRQTP